MKKVLAILLFLMYLCFIHVPKIVVLPPILGCFLTEHTTDVFSIPKTRVRLANRDPQLHKRLNRTGKSIATDNTIPVTSLTRIEFFEKKEFDRQK